MRDTLSPEDGGLLLLPFAALPCDLLFVGPSRRPWGGVLRDRRRALRGAACVCDFGSSVLAGEPRFSRTLQWESIGRRFERREHPRCGLGDPRCQRRVTRRHDLRQRVRGTEGSFGYSLSHSTKSREVGPATGREGRGVSPVCGGAGAGGSTGNLE